MISRELKVLFVLALSIANGICLDLGRLSDECLKGKLLSKLQDINCVTLKLVRIQKIQHQNDTFYCITYEKKSGNRNEFDVLSFDLHEDYDLKFTGSNVISNEVDSPKFKLYDSRTRHSYKGKFAFSSANPSFDIRKIFLNGLEQKCFDDSIQIWPNFVISIEGSEDFQESTTQRVFSVKSTTPSSDKTTVRSLSSDCGQVKSVESFGNYHGLSSNPGEFPWAVAIYRYFNEDEESFYKCAGTIVNKDTILTSVNCLLDDGLLLNPEDLKVYTSPFSLSAKIMKTRLYNIDDIETHPDYNLNLENNIAALKLTREIEFNDYVQPICLPDKDFTVVGKIGKLAGFGKSSSANQPKSDLLKAAEYEVRSAIGKSFEAENTSGNFPISDIGSGLYINETNRWTFAGIMSKKTRVTMNGMPSRIFTFTNVPKYLTWIQNQ